MYTALQSGKPAPCILLADGGFEHFGSLRRWIEGQRVRVIKVTTASEALNIVEDISHVQARLNGLIVAHRLPDAMGHRVVLDFKREFPEAPAAIVLKHRNLTDEIWARSRGILLLDTRPSGRELRNWMSLLHERTPAVGKEQVMHMGRGHTAIRA